MEDLTKKRQSRSDRNGENSLIDDSSDVIEEPAVPAFHKRLVEISENMSQEDRNKFPSDFSENLDHYLYGTPKKTP